MKDRTCFVLWYQLRGTDPAFWQGLGFNGITVIAADGERLPLGEPPWPNLLQEEGLDQNAFKAKLALLDPFVQAGLRMRISTTTTSRQDGVYRTFFPWTNGKRWKTLYRDAGAFARCLTQAGWLGWWWDSEFYGAHSPNQDPGFAWPFGDKAHDRGSELAASIWANLYLGASEYATPRRIDPPPVAYGTHVILGLEKGLGGFTGFWKGALDAGRTKHNSDLELCQCDTFWDGGGLRNLSWALRWAKDRWPGCRIINGYQLGNAPVYQKLQKPDLDIPKLAKKESGVAVFSSDWQWWLEDAITTRVVTGLTKAV